MSVLQDFSSFALHQGNIPFGQFTPQEIKHDIEHYLPKVHTRLAEIRQVPQPTFDSVVIPLERSTYEVDQLYMLFSHERIAKDTPDHQEVAPEITRMMTELGHYIFLDTELFHQVAEVYNNQDREVLSQEQSMLLDTLYDYFYDNGCALDIATQDRLKDISFRLGQLSLDFGNKVLADRQQFTKYITEDEAHGLPDSWKEQAKVEDTQKQGITQYLITLDYSRLLPVLTYSPNRVLREELYRAMMSLGCQNNEYNTQNSIEEITQLRKEKAHLLGYETYADYVLRRRMAKTRQQVEQLLDTLTQSALPYARQDIACLQEYASQDGVSELRPWDYAFYREQATQDLFSIEEEVIRQYFPLDTVLQGLFTVIGQLYGLSFSQREIPVYHDDVVTYDVYQGQERKGRLYFDFYAREGKKSGAWMAPFVKKHTDDYREYAPQVSVNTNFDRTDNPLLTFQDVRTLFHECGHALHELMACGEYQSLTGTSVYWDVVEVPSQLLENWLYQPQVMEMISGHVETGESLPKDIQHTLQQLRTFQEGYATMRQVLFAQLDWAWHTDTSFSSGEDLEKDVWQKYSLFPHIDGCFMSSSFSHIFQGGYAAGYYSYKWAESIEADVFSVFHEQGIFNPNTAKRFRELILETGGQYPPEQKYAEFLGRSPQIEALLVRAGFVS